jgi:hypothetical protein
MQHQPIRARVLNPQEGQAAKAEAIPQAKGVFPAFLLIIVAIALLVGLMFSQLNQRPLGPEISLGPVWVQSLSAGGVRAGLDIFQDQGMMITVESFDH